MWANAQLDGRPAGTYWYDFAFHCTMYEYLLVLAYSCSEIVKK